MSKIEVNTVDVASGSTLTLGSSGKTIALASGTTNSINVKDLDWQSVVSSNTTMVAGKGYFVDSSGGAKTMTLPASPSVGDTVAVHALDGQTNAVTIARNSSNIEGGTDDLSLAANYAAVTLVYSDASNGWVRHNNEVPNTFISATGGTTSTSGDYKIHTFNSSSNFVVSGTSNNTSNNSVSYLVVAGGAGGGSVIGGGGGAGGYREGKSSVDDYTASPLAATTGITVTASTYPITVGGAGSENANGSNSVFSTITSAGGGAGGGASNDDPGSNGGSGGGGSWIDSGTTPGGSGNTPPVSPPQGNNGGTNPAPAPVGTNGSGGGGGAGAVGSNGSPGGGNGGAGVTSSITASPVTRAGGGGGGHRNTSYPVGTGGSGGGGNGGRYSPGTAGTAGTTNTGSGGGGGGTGGSGGSGVVIIRYKYQ